MFDPGQLIGECDAAVLAGGGAPAVDSVDIGYSDYASLGAYTISLTVT